MSDNENNLDRLFNLPATTVQEVLPAETSGVSNVRSDLEEDFDEARTNLKDIAQISQEAMTEMARIAKVMEQPRAYDALSKLIGAAIMAQKAMVEIHKNKQDVDDPGAGSSPHTVNNTLILTTADLQKRLIAAREGLDSNTNG